jgi:hypothetical protein
MQNATRSNRCGRLHRTRSQKQRTNVSRCLGLRLHEPDELDHRPHGRLGLRVHLIVRRALAVQLPEVGVIMAGGLVAQLAEPGRNAGHSVRLRRRTIRNLCGVVGRQRLDVCPGAPWRTTPQRFPLDGTASRRPALGFRSAPLFLWHCTPARYPLASQNSAFFQHAGARLVTVGNRYRHPGIVRGGSLGPERDCGSGGRRGGADQARQATRPPFSQPR